MIPRPPSSSLFPYTTLFRSLGMAVDDFDQDGKQDAVSANFDESTITIQFGDGSGGWNGRTDVLAGSYPQFATTGDVNGDGKPDVVTADQSGMVTVFLNQGNRAFSPGTSYGVDLSAGNAFQVVIRDVNGDLRPDLIAIGNDTGLCVLLANGDGTFQAATRFATSSHPRALTAGDFDGDTNLDFITANDDNTLSVFLGLGDGTFRPRADYTLDVLPRTLRTEDLNQDGKQDLVVGAGVLASAGLRVLLGRGDGTFGQATPVNSGNMIRFAIGDLNGDGKLDVVGITGSYSNEMLTVLRG